MANIADFKADFFNSDGSTAEICGNALRCVGKFFCDKLKKRHRNTINIFLFFMFN